ncbi:ATP-dependent DNA helicase [Levilactobacillus brevis]|uniref:ATP-dependent DNA helicase n=1 Tax=Levilactobacillus brevis TaxID=1580 RepID=A0AA41EN68_LEVBR|nr:ATP-dependent DNA helicase [Levilactobacillus brevis]MBS0946762.1 ATP-dependent DNA helicase [Levilactobacillus brevis]MBS0976770.1 ATP-dependent DNA helicase [Levilactobacillus brevis]MBS1009825.1 ATP-dependent DNA helicase [Levilactobacillus brevis]MCU0200448.1 ATP-dependent DNA helicase [Levilactobacillus brevis]ODP93645.1 ATP-dependent helicase [Levilactobacillus brevis]
MTIKLGVRELVEFTLRTGDLSATSGSQNTAQLGARIHRRLQKQRDSNYQKEYYLELPLTLNNQDYLLHGRADGVTLSDTHATIEEIKTSETVFDQLKDNTLTLYWAQVKLYAHLLMQKFPALEQVTLTLTYFQTNTETTTQTEQVITKEAAKTFFDEVIAEYVTWLKFRADLQERRDPTIRQLTFPFDHYRPGQRELAVAVYKTIVTSKRLFAEAPTGTGKTISTLFPTIKAIGEGLIQRIFYLTAKQSTRRVAEEAITLMASRGLKLKSITLTAKDKIKFPEEADLAPEDNPYMLGYYDRLKPALLDLLEHHDQLTRPVIEQVARKHTLDPFEFQLDASLFCDVIIGDYNYLFDPQVHLQRFFATSDPDNFFLIDEAHNLVSRSRDMYSAAMSSHPLDHLIALSRDTDQATPKLRRRLQDLRATFDDICAPLIDAGQTDSTFMTPPENFEHDLGRLVEAVHDWLVDQPQTPFTQAILDYYFMAISYQRIADYYDDTYRMRLTIDDGQITLKQLCLDPSAFLADSLALGHGAVLFSATLSPLDYYQTVLGGDQDSLAYQLRSPFKPTNQAILVTNYIQTTYNKRDANLANILLAIKTLVDGKTGNYLIFLPSYSYLLTVSQAFQLAYPQIQTVCQQAQMAEADRSRFLASFTANPTTTLVGFALLGGIFSEGIDLKADRLIGVGIVSVGLPGINPETNLLRDYFDERSHQGFAFAYQLPGLNNVFQAAGRLIRGSHDVGVILLMDQRFASPRYTQLYPSHWQHFQRLYRPEQLSSAIHDFWHQEALSE